MIFEAIQHILTPAKREVRALGYVREAIAIEARYARCRDAWGNHLEKCRQHILMGANSRAATIMVVGSGALHDVPMAALLTQGHNLILVDIIHLPKVRRLYKNHPQVQLIEQDVTGLVSNLYQKKIISKTKCGLPETDLVISLNILSQLPLPLMKYAEKHHIPLPDNFAEDVMSSHLEMLKSRAPQILMISDLERSYKKGDDLLEKETALPDVALPDPVDTWDWPIAPKGELDRDISLTHHVGCWRI